MRLNRRGYAEEEGTIPDPPGPPLPPGMKEPLLPGELPPGFFDWRKHSPFYPGLPGVIDDENPFGPGFPSKPPVYNPIDTSDPLDLPDLIPFDIPDVPDWLTPYILDPDDFPDSIPDWLRKLFER